MNVIQDDYLSLDQSLRSLEQGINYRLEKLADFTDEMENQYGTYKDVVKGSDFMREYADAVDINTRICGMFASTSQSLIDIRTMRGMIRKMRAQHTKVQKYLNIIEKLASDLNDMQKALGALREASDKRLRFYNACQFTLTNI